MKHQEEKLGELYLFFQVVLHSLFPVLLVYGVDLIPPFQYLLYVSLIPLPLFLVPFLKDGHWKDLKKKTHWGMLLLYSSLILIPYVAIFYASQFTNSVNIVLLMQSEIVFAAIIAWLFLNENMNSKRMLGIFFALIASVIVLWNGQLTLNGADVVIFFAPLSFVLANVNTKELMKHMHWSVILVFRTVFTILVMGLLVYFREDLLPVSELNLWVLLIMGVFTGGFAKIFWQKAIHRLDVSKCTALISMTPAFSLIWSALFLKEIPSQMQWLGILFLSIGVFFLIQSRSKQWDKKD